MHILQCIMHITFYSVCNAHCTMYSTVYSLYYLMYNIHCILYIAHCTVYNAHCTMYSVQCTVYSVHTLLEITVHNIHRTIPLLHKPQRISTTSALLPTYTDCRRIKGQYQAQASHLGDVLRFEISG